jgi:hypothetical protein
MSTYSTVSVYESSISTIFNLQDLINSIRVDSSGTSVDSSGTPVDPSGVPFSIDDLINSQQVIIDKENTDRASAIAFATMPIDNIKTNMYAWASVGFPACYIVASLSLVPPAVCSDGVTRGLIQYYEWLINMDIPTWLASMDVKVSGMYFTFSHDGYSTINLHINR